VIRRFDVYTPGERLLIARSRASVLLDIAGLAALFLLGLAVLLWLVWPAGDSPRARLLFLAGALAGVGASLAAFTVLLRAYRSHRLSELVIFDRAADSVTRGGERLCALSGLAGVELRRRAGRDEEGPWFEVALVPAGVRDRSAPRPAAAAFEDTIPVGGSPSEPEMRACATRIASYSGLPVEESGF
jgi:hypothetical protein